MTEKVARTTDGKEVAIDDPKRMKSVDLPPEVSLNPEGVARDNSKEIGEDER